MTTITSNYAFHGRKPMLTVIDSAAWLGAFLIIGAIVGWMGVAPSRRNVTAGSAAHHRASLCSSPGTRTSIIPP